MIDIEDILNQVEDMENAEAFPNGLSFQTQEDVDKFALQSDEEADRFLKMYKDKMRQVIKNKEKIEAARKRYEKHFQEVEKRLNGSLEQSCAFFEGRLMEYAFRKLGSSKGKLALLNGNLEIKQPADKIQYDEDKVIAWLKEKNLGVFMKESIDKAGLKKASKKNGLSQTYNGEAIPGITYEPQPLSFKLPDVAKEMEKEKAEETMTQLTNLTIGA